MKIERIETFRIEQFPLLLWVRVFTDDGLIGVGETFYGPETAESAVHELLAPLLIGRDPAHTEPLWSDMFRLVDHFGYGGAELRGISALDTALWDIAGKAAGKPVFELLGGASRDRIKVYNTYGGADYEKDPVPFAQELLDAGIDVIKVNAFPAAHRGDGLELTPRQLDEIIRPIDLLATGLGGRMRIAVDGHGFWGLHQAMEIARALEGYPIYWIEELMSPRAPGALEQLRRVTNHPICLSERFITRFGFTEFLDRNLVDVAMPDLVWTGGISETRRIAILAESRQVPIAPHDSTGPVNMFACAHICMNAPNAMIMESSRTFYERPQETVWDPYPGLGLTSGWYWEIVEEPAVIQDGYLLAPREPGLGVRLRDDLDRRPDFHTRVSTERLPHHIRWER